MDIFAKVEVILGDDVQVEAAGFKGKLQGSLTVEQTPQLSPRGSGTIQVAAGDYRIYGQDLAIERGRVLFSGGPIDNPGLDLRVSRSYKENSEDISVGAQISGTLRAPHLELFSQPAMPDSSIISYLIFGRAPDTTSETENALLYQAASALATTGSSSTVKNISDTLGLDELSLKGGQSLNDAALVIGKYLSPELYISFGIGLFEAAETFNLRYKITDRLSLESSTSGDQSGADVIYTIEW
jgi:translocation and assembly module TamB